jgi:putative PIN family toxin of toxin-antitoxin system
MKLTLKLQHIGVKNDSIMKKVTVDTNIIISSALSPNGKADQFMRLVFDSKLQLCYCTEILTEYKEVLSRQKFNFTAEKQEYFLDGIKRLGLLIKPTKSDIPLTDESDRIFYDTAKASEAILVTGNVRHYPVEPFIMTLSDFFENYERLHTGEIID